MSAPDPVCVRARCAKDQGAEMITLSDGVTRALCRTCVAEFIVDRSVEEAVQRKMTAGRRFDVRLRALAGPAADVAACDLAGDEFTEATSAVGVAIQGWLDAGREAGRFS